MVMTPWPTVDEFLCYGTLQRLNEIAGFDVHAETRDRLDNALAVYEEGQHNMWQRVVYSADAFAKLDRSGVGSEAAGWAAHEFAHHLESRGILPEVEHPAKGGPDAFDRAVRGGLANGGTCAALASLPALTFPDDLALKLRFRAAPPSGWRCVAVKVDAVLAGSAGVRFVRLRPSRKVEPRELPWAPRLIGDSGPPAEVLATALAGFTAGDAVFVALGGTAPKLKRGGGLYLGLPTPPPRPYRSRAWASDIREWRQQEELERLTKFQEMAAGQ